MNQQIKNESNIKFIVKELGMIITDSISSHIKDIKVQYNRRMGELKQKRTLLNSLSEKQAMKIYKTHISHKLLRYDFDYSNNEQTSRPLTLRELKRQIWNKVKLIDMKSTLGGKL